ncbi:MAG: T9SS type A sorting domain-containing protein [Saprospiraceae bacterium]|nr:T9SS type A sorting domain-containing protein [Saprospiraceae bacterium]
MKYINLLLIILTIQFKICIDCSACDILPNNSSVCANTNNSFSSSGGLNYQWKITGDATILSQTNNTVIVKSGNSGSFELKCIIDLNDSCTIIVIVNPNPTVLANGKATICNGTSTTISATGALTYVWNPGNLNGAIQNVSPSTTTNYTVTGTDAKGCVNTDSVLITVNPNPTVLANGKATICNGTSTTISATGALTYVWNPGNLNGAIQNVSPSTTINYTVTGTDAKGCVNTDSVLITVNPNPTVLANGKATICNGTSTTISATGALTYVWNPGNLNGAIQNVSPSTTINYTVTGTDAKGCLNTDSVLITVNPNPTVLANGKATICNGTSTTISATGALAYVWNPGNLNGALQNVSPSATINYTVTGTDAKGCVNTDSVLITVNPNPTVLANGKATICNGTSTTISATGALAYVWNPGNLNGALQNVSPSATIIYTVTGTDKNGCRNSDTNTVKVLKLPSCDFIIIPDPVNPNQITLKIKLQDTHANEPSTSLNNYTFKIDANNLPSDTDFMKTIPYKFVSKGSHTIILEVTDSNGCICISEQSYFTNDPDCESVDFKPKFINSNLFCSTLDSIYLDLDINITDLSQVDTPKIIITNTNSSNTCYRDTIKRLLKNSNGSFFRIPIKPLCDGKNLLSFKLIAKFNKNGTLKEIICDTILNYEIFDPVTLKPMSDKLCHNDDIVFEKDSGDALNIIKLTIDNINYPSIQFPIHIPWISSSLNKDVRMIKYELDSKGMCHSDSSFNICGYGFPEITDKHFCKGNNAIDTVPKGFSWEWSYAPNFTGKTDAISINKILTNTPITATLTNLASGGLCTAKSNFTFYVDSIPTYKLDSIGCSPIYYIDSLNPLTALIDWKATFNIDDSRKYGTNRIIILETGSGILTSTVTIGGQCPISKSINVANKYNFKDSTSMDSIIKHSNCGDKVLLYYNKSDTCISFNTSWVSFSLDGILDQSFGEDHNKTYILTDKEYLKQHIIFMISRNCGTSCNGYVALLRNSSVNNDTCLLKKQSKLYLFPNPNDGYYRIQFNDFNFGNYKYKIIDILGNDIYNSQITINNNLQNSFEDMNSELHSGIYKLILENHSGERWVKNIVIIK